MSILGVVMAGGRNVRYGAHKALAQVGGRSILERVRAALEPVTAELVLVANEPEVYAGAGLPMRPDVRPGMGVLGGILTATEWAAERAHAGALVVACDMPFVPATLLREIAARAAAGDEPPPDVVAPESGGRRGIEPLCAYYGTGCVQAVRRALERDDLRVVAFFDDVRVQRIPLDEVRLYGDPELIFMNVNTPEERERAERLAAGGAA
ncbi:MAG TPA: molybdenum cofactor guanylyltransferase [Longimicrobiales bacterium]